MWIQKKLDDKLHERIREAAKRGPFALKAKNPEDAKLEQKVSRLLNYAVLESIHFGCMRCGTPTGLAFSWCAKCSASTSVF